jgi:drug/metabolite transporter (DMT)-like permease
VVAPRLFGHRRWLFAFLIGVAGWGFYIVAVHLAPLSLVQAVSAGGIALLAVFAQRALGERLPRREWIGVGMAVVGLVFLAASLAGGENRAEHASWFAVGGWFVVSWIAGALSIGPVAALLAPGAGLGLAAGLMYAAADVGTKAAWYSGWFLLLIVPVWACHGLAFTLIQLSFQRGRALATAGLSSFCTNALPIAGGILV